MDEFLRKIWELSVNKVLNESIRKAVFYTERIAKKNTPVKDWYLRNSYERKFNNLEWRLRNFRSYAIYVHEWHSQEVWRYVPAIWKRLVQPYVQGNPWMDRTYTEVWPKIYRIFEKDVENFLQELTT